MADFDFKQMMGNAQQQGQSTSAKGDVFSDVMGFLGAMIAEDQRTRAAQYSMAQADENAEIAAMSAADAIRRGNIEAGKLRMQGTIDAAGAAVAYQGGGVDATVGTPADTQGAIAQGAELDAQVAANNAAREAWGQRVQSRRFKEQRANILDEWKAKNQSYNLNQIGTIGKFALDAAKAG